MSPPLDEGPVLLWTEPNLIGRLTDPTTDGRRMFISGPGAVGAFDARTGEFLWEFDGGIVGFARPAYRSLEDLIVVSWRGVLRGLSAQGGREIWATDAAPTRWTETVGQGAPTDALVVDEEGTVYVSNDELIARIDPSTGEVVWERDLEGTGGLALAAGSNEVCARRSPVVNVTCYAESDGRILWSIPQLEIARPGGILVVDDRVVVEADGWVGLLLSSGDEVWRRSGITASLDRRSVAMDGIVYACEPHCLAIRGRDGEELWRGDVELLARPAVSTEHLFVDGPTGQSDLLVLDTQSGRLVDTIELEEGNRYFLGNPAYGDGRLFVRTEQDTRAYRYP